MVRSRRNNTPTEHLEQAVLFQWADFAENDKRIPQIIVNDKKMSVLDFMHAIPNGGKRNIKTANDLKAEGVKAGVPDISLPYPTSRHHGLYIELKRQKGGKLSEKQEKWLEYLNNAGYLAVVCKGFEQAKEIILQYLEEKI